MLNASAVLKGIVASGIALFSASVAAATLTVTVANIAAEAGQVRIAVYDKETWLSTERWVARQLVSPTGATIAASFELPPGTYAVAVLHDVNGNGRMDYRWMRLPKEPYGFSNGVVPRFGPPRFEDCSFAVADEDVRITIELGD